MLNYFLITLFLIITAFLQLAFKTLAMGPGGTDILALVQDPLFYVCGTLLILQSSVWLMVLRSMPLSKAYPFTSLTVVIMLINASLFFGESITLGNILGSILIILGIIVIASDQGGLDIKN